MDKEVVLITGGTGLVGKVLKPMLETAGYQVIMLSRSVKNNQSYLWDKKLLLNAIILFTLQVVA
jgi:NAD dependent epimerase/dehydratase family enzyme